MPDQTDRTRDKRAHDSGPTSTTDRDQPSALGGNVATRSSTAPEAEDTDGKGTGGMVAKRDAGGAPGEPGGRGDTSGG